MSPAAVTFLGTAVAAGDVVHAMAGMDQGPVSGIASCAALATILGAGAVAARIALLGPSRRARPSR